jgi:RNA polymerase sigma factor (sigma-70 family)
MGALLRPDPAAVAALADPLAEPLRRYLLTGDEGSLELVVRETRPRLLAAARRIGAPQDAEDAVQSAYLSLVRKRGGPLEAPVFPWLLTATVRLAYRHKAAERRQLDLARALSRPVEAAPAAAGLDADEASLLRREVQRLPDRYRDAVILHYLQGLTAAETARLLDVPEATVRTRLHRARALLRSRWSPRLVYGLLLLPWLVADAMRAAGPGTMAAGVGIGGVMKAGTAAAVAAAAILAGAAGWAARGSAAGGAPADGSGVPAPGTPGPEAAASKAEAASLRARLAEIEKERDALKEASAEAAREVETLRASVEELRSRPVAAAGGRVRKFTFAQYDEVLAGVDWKAVGHNTSKMLPLLVELARATKEGKELRPELIGEIVNHNGPLVMAAMKVNGKLPGSGVNGAFTHPAFQVNSMASTLDEAGLPLSEAQFEALQKVGRDFTDQDEARRGGYEASTFELQKVLDETSLKDRFFDACFALMTPEQRELLSPAATRGIVSIDLYSSGLMWMEHMQPVREATVAGFVGRATAMLQSRLGVPEDKKEGLRGLVEEFAGSLPAESDSASVFGQPVMRATWVAECARKYLALLQKIPGALSLADEATVKARAIRQTILYLKAPASADGDE